MFKQTILVCGIFSGLLLSASENTTPVARWGFEAITNNRIAPVAGSVQGRVMPKGEYKLVDGVSGKALQFGDKVGGVLLPLDRTCTADEYEPCARRMAEYIGKKHLSKKN